MQLHSTTPNYIRAEAKSLALLQRFDIGTPNFDVEDIAYALRIEVIFGGVSAGDARIVRRDDGSGVIRLNKSIVARPRQRFSIAHELGHWEMHPLIKQGFLCTGQNLRDYGRSPEEAEANWFAATLLMPKFLIPHSVFKKDPNFDFVAQLAGDFGTSLTAAARRFVELSNQPIVLVASSSGSVDWIARSKPAIDKYLFVKPGSSLPNDSLTAEVFSTKPQEPRSAAVDPLIWFPDSHFDDDAELFEHSKYSEIYESALTLLWLPQ